MPICQNCHHTWTWKETFKRSFTFDGGMECPYCKKMQYYSARFRKISSIIPFAVITLIMSCNFLFGPSYIFVIALLSLIPLYIVIYPFTVKLSNEEKPLF